MKKLRRLSCHFTFIIALLLFFIFNIANALAEENQLKGVIKRVMPATVLVVTYDEKGQPLLQGSGFFVSENGEVITNYHVMNGAVTAGIKTSDGSIYKITGIIAEDLAADLLKMQADTGSNKAQFLTINKTPPEVGDKVVIIGSPKGLENTVSDGIVSAVRDVPGFGSIIQTTAPISPGSSGSPVVNMKGEVVGVASAQMREGQNLNFVVPAAKIIGLKEKKQAIEIRKKDKTKTETNDIFSTALFYYFKEDCEKALPFFEQYLKIHPYPAEAWFYAGCCYSKSGHHQEAIQSFKQAIRLNPDDAVVHYNLGHAYADSGRYQAAIQSFKQAIRLKPDFADAHNNLGYVYGKSGHHQEEIQAYKQAIRLKPDFADAHYNLGLAFADSGHFQEAIQAYKQAIRLKPDYAAAHFTLGITYSIMGDSGNALKEYKILKNLNAELANTLFNEIYK